MRLGSKLVALLHLQYARRGVASAGVVRSLLQVADERILGDAVQDDRVELGLHGGLHLVQRLDRLLDGGEAGRAPRFFRSSSCGTCRCVCKSRSGGRRLRGRCTQAPRSSSLCPSPTPRRCREGSARRLASIPLLVPADLTATMRLGSKLVLEVRSGLLTFLQVADKRMATRSKTIAYLSLNLFAP